MSIKDKLRGKCPRWILHGYRYIRFPEYRNTCDRKHCFGKKNPDKTFFVFRNDMANWGIYTIIFDSFLNKLEQVLEKGYIPIFDLQNYRPFMLEDGQTFNLWERFFRLADDSPSLSEVYQSHNVIMGQLNSTELRQNSSELNGFMSYITPNKMKIFNKYMCVNSEIENRVNDAYNELFPKGKKIMGIAIRECYRYVNIRYKEEGTFKGHPIVSEPKKQISTIERYLEKWKCDMVYVVSDDRECLEILKNYFKERIIYFGRPLMHFFQDGEIVIDDNEAWVEFDNSKKSRSERMIDYMIEVELLSRCNALLSGISSGAEAALLRNAGKYENVEIYDTGRY